MDLKICTDGSMRNFENGRSFGCAGAIAIDSMQTMYRIIPDTTNNRCELMAIYLGVKLAQEIVCSSPLYDSITIYSDSQFSVYGLNKWMYSWLRYSDKSGTLYNKKGSKVANQELYKLIIKFIIDNGLRIKFMLQQGHTDLNKQESVRSAIIRFKNENGVDIDFSTLYNIISFNNIVDTTTRNKLKNLDLNDYPVDGYLTKENDYDYMNNYRIPKYFNNYIL